MAIIEASKEDRSERRQAGAQQALALGTSGASVGTAVTPGIGTAIGAGVGAALGYAMGYFGTRATQKRMDAMEEDTDAALERSEKEAAQLMQRQSKKESAAATRASAQGKILGGSVDDVLYEAAATGANLEGFKRRKFPIYG